MAIDENLIGEVRPNESAVGRLRKRNRIRPWESGLVGAQEKSKLEGAGNPPTGQHTQWVQNPEGEIPTVPLGNSPSGSVTQRTDRPLGMVSDPGCEKGSHNSHESPPDRNTQRANYPVSELPSGYPTQGNIPTGSNTPEVNHPVGSLPRGQDTPSPQNPIEPRSQLISGFDPAPFVPADKGPVLWREKGSGELRIPHRLYEFAHRVTSTRNELLVFDCLLRFSLGFHRSWCEAGYSFIGAWTGINDITNIKKSLKALIGAGIVVKVQEHNSICHSGAIYEIPVVKGYLEYAATKKEPAPNDESEKYPVGNLPTGCLTQGGAAPSVGGQETHGGVGDLPPKKENINKNSKKTLSQECSADLDAYVDQIKPASKRESEINFLSKLLSEYSSQEVALSLTYVQRFGVLGSKEKCHTPLKYLSTAIEQVLPKARENQKMVRVAGCQDSVTKVDKSSEENDSTQTRLRSIAISAFETELTQSEQDLLFSEIAMENSVMGYAPPMSVLRNLAAVRWYERRNRITV